MNKNTLRLCYFGFVCFFVIAALLSFNFLPKSVVQIPSFFPSPTSASQAPTSPPFFSRVIRVIDGDTIEIEDKKIVRYIGINTPETKHPNKSIECFGKEASLFNKQLVEGKLIKLERDVSETDKYKRLLRYAWIVESENATRSAIFINDFLVRQGYAYASTFPPDVKFNLQLIDAQREAMENKRGLWNKCK